jgi:hypothetical protein
VNRGVDRWTVVERMRIKNEPCPNCHAKQGDPCFSISKAQGGAARKPIKDFHALRVLAAFPLERPA